jgi:hypothetical protein
MNNTPVMKKKSSSGALGVAGPDETQKVPLILQDDYDPLFNNNA